MICTLLATLFEGWGASETIALVALGVAIWAGCSASRSADEARRANAQAMYHERRAVFDAFLNLSMHMAAHGQKPDMAVVGQFYRYVHTAGFCFEKELAQKLVDYFNAAFAVADFARAHEGMPKPPEDIAAKLAQVYTTSDSLLEELKKAVPAQ